MALKNTYGGTPQVITHSEANSKHKRIKSLALLILDAMDEVRTELSACSIRDKWRLEVAYRKLSVLEDLSWPFLEKKEEYIAIRAVYNTDFIELNWMESREDRDQAFHILRTWFRDILMILYTEEILTQVTWSAGV